MITKQEQAKNGFKTFIITLSVSLVIFSSIYYLLGNFTNKVDIEEFSSHPQTETALETGEDKVQGVTTESTESPFKKLAQDETAPSVLQAETEADDTETEVATTTTTTTTTTETEETEESTESVVPETGSATLIGTILSATLFSVALFIILSGPRKTALSKFEDSMLNN